MPTICEPGVKSDAGRTVTVWLKPLRLVAHQLTDFDSFKVTVRADPEWPRTLDSLPYDQVDPVSENWAVAAEGTGALNDNNVPAINVVMPPSAGDMRYVIDAVGVIGSLEVQLVECTWLSLRGRSTE